MAEKLIKIDGRDVLFRSTAATPRRFRNKFHEDMLSRMEAFSENVNGEDKQMMPGDYEFLENCAYIMCADKAKPENVEDWLEGFDTFSILEIMDQIMDLWTENLQTMEANGVEPLNQDKKK